MISPNTVTNVPFAVQRRAGLWQAGATLLNNLSTVRGMSAELNTLISGLPARIAQGSGRTTVTALCTDSRRVSPGALFFAVGGLRTDGNLFVEEAIHRGAAAIVSESDPGRLPARVTYVQVENVRKALADVARRFYKNPESALDCIGITGTNGKTTVATLCKHMIESCTGDCVGMIGTVAYMLGRRSLPASRTTPEASELFSMFDQMRESGCSHMIMEVSSHGIAQDRVWHIPFKIAAFTNLTQDHMDYHHTMEDYFQVKARLFSGETGQLPEVAVINRDDPFGRRLLGVLPEDVRAVTFGEAPESTYHARKLEMDDSGSHFELRCPHGVFPVHSPLLGRYNVSNVLCALAIVHSAGFPIERCIEALASFPGVPGRMEKVETGQSFNVLVDYAHTPDALKNALEMLRPITRGRLLVVFGCGGNRDRGKRPLMTRAVQDVADEAWATADNPRGESICAIFEDMRTGVTKPDVLHWIEDRRRAIHLALSAAEEGDCVLIAGKGHESYQEFSDTVATFDDRLVARELLRLSQAGQQ